MYRGVVELSRLASVQSFSDENGGIARAPFFDGRWPMEMLTVVTLEEDGDGTVVTLTCSRLNAEAHEQANFVSNISSMQGGWGISFDALAEVLAAGE